MEEQFIPYEQALKLKELGFKEECFGFYNNADGNAWIKHLIDSSIKDIYTGDIQAPLWQQAFDWFRKIGYDTSILRVPPEMVGKGRIKKYSYFIWKEDDNPRGNQDFEDTYEEAREKCLKKLIELCKNVK